MCERSSYEAHDNSIPRPICGSAFVAGQMHWGVHSGVSLGPDGLHRASTHYVHSWLLWIALTVTACLPPLSVPPLAALAAGVSCVLLWILLNVSAKQLLCSVIYFALEVFFREIGTRNRAKLPPEGMPCIFVCAPHANQVKHSETPCPRSPTPLPCPRSPTPAPLPTLPCPPLPCPRSSTHRSPAHAPLPRSSTPPRPLS